MTVYHQNPTVEENTYSPGTTTASMDRQQLLAIILVVLMVGSSFAYAATSIF